MERIYTNIFLPRNTIPRLPRTKKKMGTFVESEMLSNNCKPNTHTHSHILDIQNCTIRIHLCWKFIYAHIYIYDYHQTFEYAVREELLCGLGWLSANGNVPIFYFKVSCKTV